MRVFESVGLAADCIGTPISWEANHTHTIVSVSPISTAPSSLYNDLVKRQSFLGTLSAYLAQREEPPELDESMKVAEPDVYGNKDDV